MRRPRLFSLVVILAAITLRGTYAAAVLPTVQAKAADCCRTRCDHGQSPPQSDRCCSVAAHAGDPLTVGVSSVPDAPGTVAVPCAGITLQSDGHLAFGDLGRVLARKTGPPLFLVLRNIRR